MGERDRSSPRPPRDDSVPVTVSGSTHPVVGSQPVAVVNSREVVSPQDFSRPSQRKGSNSKASSQSSDDTDLSSSSSGAVKSKSKKATRRSRPSGCFTCGKVKCASNCPDRVDNNFVPDSNTPLKKLEGLPSAIAAELAASESSVNDAPDRESIRTEFSEAVIDVLLETGVCVDRRAIAPLHQSLSDRVVMTMNKNSKQLYQRIVHLQNSIDKLKKVSAFTPSKHKKYNYEPRTKNSVNYLMIILFLVVTAAVSYFTKHSLESNRYMDELLYLVLPLYAVFLLFVHYIGFTASKKKKVQIPKYDALLFFNDEFKFSSYRQEKFQKQRELLRLKRITDEEFRKFGSKAWEKYQEAANVKFYPDEYQINWELKLSQMMDSRSNLDSALDLQILEPAVKQFLIVSVKELDGVKYVAKVRHQGHVSLGALTNSIRSKLSTCKSWDTVDVLVRNSVAQTLGATNSGYADLVQQGILSGTTLCTLWLASEQYVPSGVSAKFSRDF